MYNYAEIVDHAGIAAINILKREYQHILVDNYLAEMAERVDILKNCIYNLTTEPLFPSVSFVTYNYDCDLVKRDDVLKNPEARGKFELKDISLHDCYIETYNIPDNVPHIIYPVMVCPDIVKAFNNSENTTPYLSTMFRVGNNYGTTIRDFEAKSYPLCTLYKMPVSRCSYVIQWLLTYFDQMRAVVSQSLVEYIDKKFNGALFEYRKLENGNLKLVAVFS